MSVTPQIASGAIYDVVIIGGGPAGSTCALRLRQQLGEAACILMVERRSFPRDKVCGCCLNGNAVATLAAVGQERLLSLLGAIPLHTWEARFAGGAPIVASLPGGFAVSRSALDEALFRAAARAGVETHQPCSAKILSTPPRAGSGEKDEAVFIELRPAAGPVRQVAARAVVVATGLAGGGLNHWLPWRQRPSGPIGMGATFASSVDAYSLGTIYMACDALGYAGIVRLEDGRLDVAAAIYDPTGRGGDKSMGRRIQRILDNGGLPRIPELADVSWKGTPALNRQRVAGRGRVLAVGDAAGYVEPFTGEGLAWAMQTARLAADAIASSPGTIPYNVGRRYWHSYRRSLVARRLPCRLTVAALRHRKSRRVLTEILMRAPWLARPVIRLLNRAS